MPINYLQEIQFDDNQTSDGNLNINISNLEILFETDQIEKLEFSLDFKRFKSINLTIDDNSSIEITKSIFKMIELRGKTVSVIINYSFRKQDEKL